MNNKGEAPIGAIILVILLVLVFLGGFTLMLILINQKTSDKQNHLEKVISVYVNNVDNQSKTQLDGKFYIFYESELIEKGNLDKRSLVEIKNISYNRLKVYCKSDGYYLSNIEKNFTQIEIYNNASKITCNSVPYGDLRIESDSNINSNEGYIKLDITSKRQFNNISGVISWKSGTIWVKYLDKDTDKIPDRFKSENDYAFNTNISLDDSNTTILLEYKAIENRNSDDCITITIFDNDFYLDQGKLKISDYNGENLGNPKDFTKTFCYGE
jgi:hypothetical protein